MNHWRKHIATWLKRVWQSQLGWLLCVVHLVLYCYVIFEKPAVMQSTIHDSWNEPAGVIYLAGRYFHWHYESLLYQIIALVDLPAWLLVALPVEVVGLLLWLSGLQLSAWNESWLMFSFVLLSTSVHWLLLGYLFERVGTFVWREWITRNGNAA